MAKIRWNWPFIIGFLVVFVAANIGMVIYSSSNHFCSNLCHTMKPYAATWQVSSHGPKVLGDKAVACEECHYDPGLGGWIRAKMGGMRSMYKQVTATWHSPIKGEAKEVRCKECHEHLPDETETHRIPHQAHAEMGLGCQSCHAGLVHGHAGEGEAKVTHAACQQCHDTENQDECTKCHKW